jgi:hypothetical protein
LPGGPPARTKTHARHKGINSNSYLDQ